MDSIICTMEPMKFYIQLQKYSVDGGFFLNREKLLVEKPDSELEVNLRLSKVLGLYFLK